MNTEQSQWPPRTVRETLPYINLCALCLICFISPPSMMLQREQAFKTSLILVLGLLSWVAIVVYHSYFWPERHTAGKALLGIFAVGIVLTVLFAPDHASAFSGTTYDRIGAAYLLSLIGIGVVMRKLGGKVLLTSVYSSILILAIVSIPYNLLFFGNLVRLSGPLRQPDILAVWLGCGFLFGLAAYVLLPRFRKAIVAGQTLLVATILLTGTRAIIVLVPLMTLLYLWRVKRPQKIVVGAAITAACLFIVLLPLIHAHFNHTNDAQIIGNDTLLRLHVQAVGVHSLRAMPLTGYGPGHIMDVLACSKLTSPDLLRVCNLHLAFTSSHNIYLDRLLEFGWLGGVSFMLLIGYALYKGYRSVDIESYAMACSLLLISLYYLTNITTPEVELLAWIILILLLFRKIPVGFHNHTFS